MCLHEEKASFRYPWNIHMYLIFPLAAITLFTAFAFGWQGEGPYHVFTEFRAAYPFLSRVFHSITDWGNPLLYCIYVMLLIRAIRTGDIKIIWNIVCVLILSLLFLGIFLQLLKYGLGYAAPRYSLASEAVVVSGIHIVSLRAYGEYSCFGHPSGNLDSGSPVQDTPFPARSLYGDIPDLAGSSSSR